ncbi:galactokinase [bacterium]|nr:galactokinase [bacterium]
MASHKELLGRFETERAKQVLSRLYGEDPNLIATQLSRYARLIREHERHFGGDCQSVRLFRAPGRVEVGGNHTDHNHGRVLAAAINLDAIAAACRCPGSVVTVRSEGYTKPFVVDVADLDKKNEESESSLGLIRGICRAFRDRGYEVGGFNASVSSDVAVGSGLSSSAAFEVLIGTILNSLFNDRRVSAKDIALAGQYAENEYFGKPSGLMDQMTIAVGGLVTIDFADSTDPVVKKVDFDFDSCGFDVVVVNTGGSHADLTRHYSAVAQEMREVAKALGVQVLRESSAAQLMQNVKELRRRVGDRAILRALHFFADNERVTEQVDTLETGDFRRFLRLVNESGRSSWMLLQNVYDPERPEEQGLTLALALTQKVLSGKGACRVHGGGFAGTILAFVPREMTAEYVAKMDGVFGEGAARQLRIRSQGAGEIITGE